MPSAESRIVYYYKDGKYYVGTFAEKNVADEYDPSSSYAVGDMVDYLGTLYMCSAATTGSFDSTKWTQIKLANVVEAKQDVLTFDNSPTSGSNNPVKSGGVYSAIQNHLNFLSVVDGKVCITYEN